MEAGDGALTLDRRPTPSRDAHRSPAVPQRWPQGIGVVRTGKKGQNLATDEYGRAVPPPWKAPGIRPKRRTCSVAILAALRPEPQPYLAPRELSAGIIAHVRCGIIPARLQKGALCPAETPRSFTMSLLRHIWHFIMPKTPYEADMSNLKALRSLTDLGQNLRQARLSRRFSIAELATRAGKRRPWGWHRQPCRRIGGLGKPAGSCRSHVTRKRSRRPLARLGFRSQTGAQLQTRQNNAGRSRIRRSTPSLEA
jgi:hypothetical protein